MNTVSHGVRSHFVPSSCCLTSVQGIRLYYTDEAKCRRIASHAGACGKLNVIDPHPTLCYPVIVGSYDVGYRITYLGWKCIYPIFVHIPNYMVSI